MLKRFFLIPIISLLMLFTCISSAQAYINSQQDLHNAILKIYDLRNFDSMKFISKSELIGERLTDFNEARYVYNSTLESGMYQLMQFEEEINRLNNSTNMDQRAIDTQIQRIYNNANAVVSNINSQAGMYIQRIRYSMPTMTYQKYRKKFYEYYESVNL